MPDIVLIVVYVDQETKHLYAEAVEDAFTSGGGQSQLEIYSKRNRIISLHKDNGRLNSVQKEELEKFWLLADSVDDKKVGESCVYRSSIP